MDGHKGGMMENYQALADKAFLALCVWREARGESLAAQTGVAYVIMNRVKKPSWWGHDVMSVLFKKWQFSSLTDPGDKQLTRWPDSSDESWQRCLEVACNVIERNFPNTVRGADHYYDISIRPPKWADPLKFVAQVGRLRFYDLDFDTESVWRNTHNHEKIKGS
jgi:spore germination cell wall hydrolase CwlJ-like protein